MCSLYRVVHMEENIYTYLIYNLFVKNVRQKALSNLNKFSTCIFILVKWISNVVQHKWNKVCDIYHLLILEITWSNQI